MKRAYVPMASTVRRNSSGRFRFLGIASALFAVACMSDEPVSGELSVQVQMLFEQLSSVLSQTNWPVDGRKQRRYLRSTRFVCNCHFPRA